MRSGIPKPDEVLAVYGLAKSYRRQSGPLRGPETVTALNGVDLRVASGRTLALVGESGSGKSTLGRCLALLEAPDRGELWFRTRDLATLTRGERAEVRQKIQLVFQDPLSAMNPRLNAAQIVGEIFRIRGSRTEPHDRVVALVEGVGLPSQCLTRSPLEFSGGQRQRLAIARALAAEPEVLILDEAFSGLDGSTQKQIANLLCDLRARSGLTCVVITHDLALAADLADDVAVLQDGRIVESGAVSTVLGNPRHTHTRDLLDAMPKAPSHRPKPGGGIGALP